MAQYWLLSTAKKLIWWRLSSAQVYEYKSKYTKEDLVTCPHSFLTSTLSTLWPGLMGHHQRGGNQNGKARRWNIVIQVWRVFWTWKALHSWTHGCYSKLCKVKESKFQPYQKRICKTLLLIQEFVKSFFFVIFLVFNNIVFLSLSSLKAFPYTTIFSPFQIHSVFEGLVNQWYVFYVTRYMHASMRSPNQT